MTYLYFDEKNKVNFRPIEIFASIHDKTHTSRLNLFIRPDAGSRVTRHESKQTDRFRNSV